MSTIAAEKKVRAIAPTRPLIRYYGGKWLLAPWILSHFPAHRVYIDPPYVHETRDAGGDYRHEMTNDDHRELEVVLRELSGMVVLSGYECPLYDELYAGWRMVLRSALADGARPRMEMLLLSPNVPVRQGTLFEAKAGGLQDE